MAAPVRKKAGDANTLNAVDGRLTRTASKSPCMIVKVNRNRVLIITNPTWSTESAAADAPEGFLWGWEGPEDVPGRDCGLVEMEGRGEEGALEADERGREGVLEM